MLAEGLTALLAASEHNISELHQFSMHDSNAVFTSWDGWKDYDIKESRLREPIEWSSISFTNSHLDFADILWDAIILEWLALFSGAGMNTDEHGRLNGATAASLQMAQMQQFMSQDVIPMMQLMESDGLLSFPVP